MASEPIGSDCCGDEDDDEWEGYWGDLYPEDEEEQINGYCYDSDYSHLNDVDIETFSGAEVHPVSEPIAQEAKNSPAVEVDPVEESSAQAGPYSPGVDVDYIESQLQEPLLEASPGACDCPFCGAQHGLFVDRDLLNRFVIRCLHCDNNRLKTYPGAIRSLAKESVLPPKSGGTFCKLAAKPIGPAAKTSPGVEVDQKPIAQEHFFNTGGVNGQTRNTYGFTGLCVETHRPEDPAAELYAGSICAGGSASEHETGDRVLETARDSQRGKRQALLGQSTKLVNQAAKTSPGVKVDYAEDILPNCVVCFGDKFIEDASGCILNCVHCTEARMRQSAIGLGTENSPGVKPDQNPIAQAAETSTAKVSSSKKANSYLDCPSCGIGRLRVKQSIYWETSCKKCGYFAESILYPFTPADTGYKVGDWVKVRIKPRLATNICRGEVVCIDKVQDDYLRFVNPNLNPALVIWVRQQFLHPHEVSPCEPPVKAAETAPGVKTEPKVSKSAIVQAAKTSPGVEVDQTPILTGIALSDRFLATYPPYFGEIHYKAEDSGQLNLLEPVTDDEPPDPDDFESLDAFREAIARWDWEHPTSSFDYCSDLLPSSVQNELPLQVSLDSFCLWAHCPDDWYEPAVLLEPSPAHKSSITSDFFIPTFGSLGDRFNGSDEPPDTGIFARLPKPKPPKFPPQAVSWAQVNHKSAQVSRHPETISKLFHRVAAGISNQPARSPPGGDAMS
ncbi:hypothetical protein QUB56_34770 [Microcoleus sp. AR_TQ3_B6]|uniref:hypothetical protein n=1 Tax=Microcoleus sp. AR_TQ3_B6 TaxID=3055284 RepID=UPI002FD13510